MASPYGSGRAAAGAGAGAGAGIGSGVQQQQKPRAPALPDKLRVGKTAATKRVFSDRLTVATVGGRRRPREDTARRPRTFVDSLPIGMAALEAAAGAIRSECDRTFGPGRHAMSGKNWHAPPDAKPASAAFLSRKVPWRFLAGDGARDVLDTEHYDRNPHVELGVSGRGSTQVHAIVTAFTEVISEWVQAGTRLYMGRRRPTDDTPEGSLAPAAFPTQHAMLLTTPPRQWEVPEALAGAVSRVIARLDDSVAETRFWVVAPVQSAALRPSSAEWYDFVGGLCAAAAAAEPIEGISAVLCPIVPGLTYRNPLAGVMGLEHAVREDVPPAHILDAFLSTYLQFDETGVEPAENAWEEDNGWEEDEDEEGDEDDAEGGDGAAKEDAEEEDTEGTGGTEEPEDKEPAAKGNKDNKSKEDKERTGKARALAFAPDADLLVAVCDTRVAFPLLTAVVCNDELRHMEFRGHRDDEEGGDGGGVDGGDEGGDEKGGKGGKRAKKDGFTVDWGQFRDKRQWLAWTPRM